MKKIKINKSKLYSLYMNEIHIISEILEDKSYFSPEEIVGIICEVLEKNPELIQEKSLKL